VTGSIPPHGPLAYEGQVVTPFIRKTFDPETTFNQFPVPTIWINTATSKAFILVSLALGVADWISIGGASGAMNTLTTQDGIVVPPDLGNINVVGDGVRITTTGSIATNTVTIHLDGSGLATAYVTDNGIAHPAGGDLHVLGSQGIRTIGAGSTVTVQGIPALAAATTSLANVGVASFENEHFNVDGNGFVTLKGGGQAADSIGVDTNTAPGTDPVLPDSNSLITITGGQIAANSTANVIRTNSLAANTFTIQTQRSMAFGTSDVTKNGVCHFDSNAFGVDGNGFVTVSNSAGNFLQQKRQFINNVKTIWVNSVVVGDPPHVPTISQGTEIFSFVVNPIKSNSVFGIRVNLNKWEALNYNIYGVYIAEISSLPIFVPVGPEAVGPPMPIAEYFWQNNTLAPLTFSLRLMTWNLGPSPVSFILNAFPSTYPSPFTAKISPYLQSSLVVTEYDS